MRKRRLMRRERIKWFLIDNKAWVIFIVSLIISAGILVTELVFGKALKLISLPGGGERMAYLTWGGNICEHIYPLQVYGQPPVQESTNVTFSIFFLLFYFLRFIIIIPVVNLLLQDDNSQPLITPGGVRLTDAERSKYNRNAWLCAKCKKLNQAYTGTCCCGMTKQESLDLQSKSRNPSSGNAEDAKNG